jgi:gliding motility-associated-like protein
LAYSDNRADSVTVSGRTFTGSGPYTVTFSAEAPATATYVCWEIASDATFTDIVNRFLETTVEYEFRDAGTFYACFTTASADGSDETYGEAYTITITESLLQIPNLITPDSPTGTNQVFKVKYRSLRRFEMWVFNRWGNQLFHTTNPDDGWDGTAHGKTVPTGAYYYIIKAEGTDGINYQKKGDINVLRTREARSTTM